MIKRAFRHTNPEVKSLLHYNNFDLLRFVFAFIVLLVHAHVLSGHEELSVLSEWLSSEIAVKSFFVVSGFLIFMSYENSNNIKSYFEKRIRRIYPAYFFVIVACAFIGVFFTSYPLNNYFSLPLLKYVAANLLFMNFLFPTLPGVFENNIFHAVNGALWTLKIEAMFYLTVPLIVWTFYKYGRLKTLLAAFIFSVGYSIVMMELERRTGSAIYRELQRQLPGQLVFFLAGAAGYYYLEYLKKYWSWLLCTAVIAFLLKEWLPWLVIEPLALSIVVICLACFRPLVVNFGKFGDFSYGIYITHFPILQALIASQIIKDSPWMLLLVAVALVLITAFLFWHLIEKPFLKKSSHYITQQT